MSRKVALITGASAGLGVHFARRFARDGHDVILVARGASKLEELAAALEKEHGVKAHVLPADLAKPEAPEQLFAQVAERGLTVDFLVNNAGFGTSGPFLDQDVKREAEMVQVNCTALLKLAHLFARPMRERGQGRILNVASTAAFQAGPYMSTYYATKAFVVSLSEFAQRAGNDKSRLFQRSGVAKPEDVVEHAYKAMMRGKVLAVHGALNVMASFMVRFSPRSAATAIAAGLNQQA